MVERSKRPGISEGWRAWRVRIGSRVVGEMVVRISSLDMIGNRFLYVEGECLNDGVGKGDGKWSGVEESGLTSYHGGATVTCQYPS